MFNKSKNFFRKELEDYKMLLRAIPSAVVMFFVLSVVCMNLLANKLLLDPSVTERVFGGFTLDCGFTLSWISFLCMDMVCKRFGPKAATKLSIFAIVINFLVTVSFWLLMKTPGLWWPAYLEDGSTDLAINAALNSVFSGSWAIVVGSAVAMLLSSIVNALLNSFIGKAIHDDSTTYGKFAIRSFISTGIAQWVDNLVFVLALGLLLYRNIPEYFSAANLIINPLIGMGFELICEVIFSPIGYKISKGWSEDRVGQAYLDSQED